MIIGRGGVRMAQVTLGCKNRCRTNRGKYLVWGDGKLFEVITSATAWRAHRVTGQELAMSARLKLKS